MIANPGHSYFQYNPYTKIFSIEKYDYKQMIYNRQGQMDNCRISPGNTVGIILGVLGRQGSNHILNVALDDVIIEDDIRDG